MVIVNVVNMITTKKGDKGQTVCGNKQVDKDSCLVEVIGTIDELQAVLELIKGEGRIVGDLYQLMGRIACGSEVDVKEKIVGLEKRIVELESGLPELNKFLSFKNSKALKLNWARTISRRLERRIVSLSKNSDLDGEILEYFNRLSDYLFMEARKAEEG